jgi:membrane protein YdbS with pleckstrin-like domain
MASFRSKHDPGLVALSFGVLVVLWGVAWDGAEARWSSILMTALAVLATVTVLWTLRVMRYDVTATTLEVRSGPLLWKIQIASVGSVEPAREMGTAPA